MAEPQEQLEGLTTEWNICKAQDDQKHLLITDLFAYIDRLSKKLSEAECELRDKRDVIKLSRDRFDEAQKQIQLLEVEKARQVFASVLIDGDCMPVSFPVSHVKQYLGSFQIQFKDELVRQGTEGGKRTASLLKQAVEEELLFSTPSAAHRMQVIVRVYANVKGLAKTYTETDILPNSALFDQFVRGFNMGDAMCDYIDAGDGKECSDEKIKATFRHHSADVHCRRILFGGTADNGYARLLGPLIDDEAVCGRITLLEGPPFARELANIKEKFRTVSFDCIFRNQKLVKRRVSFHLTPPSTPVVDYAMAAGRAPSTPVPHSATDESLTVSGRTATTAILRNPRGQRVDSPLNYSQPDFINLKGRKLCNPFYLLGRCRFLEDYGHCQHDHEAKLNDRQKIALRAVARQSVCPNRLNCSNVDCLCGHRCTRNNCSRKDCWFPPEMHNVDINIVGQI